MSIENDLKAADPMRVDLVSNDERFGSNVKSWQTNKAFMAPNKGRKLKRLIVHCSATHANQNVDAATIRRWHVEGNGWSDIGYHFVTGRNGLFEFGRPLEKAGAHTYGHNRDSIGLCLIGGHGASADDHFTDHFTAEQATSLVFAVKMAQRIGLSVHGHNEFANKGCPGFRVDQFIKEYVK